MVMEIITTKKFFTPTLSLTIISLIALAILPFFVESIYVITFFYLVLLNIALAESWNLIGGYCGQILLGMSAFIGVGAYTSSILYASGTPAFLSVLLGGVMAVCLSFVLIPTFRLRGVYFAIGTLFFPEIIRVIVISLGDITGGAGGFYLPLPEVFTPLPYYFSALGLAVVTIITVNWLINSKIGLAIRAIRDNEDAAQSIGIFSVKYKILALAICAFFAGLAGGIHSFYLLFLEPHSAFSIMWSVAPVFMVIIGGSASLIGPIIGAIIFTSLSQLLTMVVGEIHLTIFGIILIAVMLFSPEGLIKVIRKLLTKNRLSLF